MDLERQIPANHPLRFIRTITEHLGAPLLVAVDDNFCIRLGPKVMAELIGPAMK